MARHRTVAVAGLLLAFAATAQAQSALADRIEAVYQDGTQVV
jgi:hypothetical protein